MVEAPYGTRSMKVSLFSSGTTVSGRAGVRYASSSFLLAGNKEEGKQEDCKR